mmetsp:Transcript_15252/g.43396  ORF Transcript_15252/g.43396 Transcript_15252/m.43396 type:complete len:466 (-) Transcript_15252:1566-2963(-)
MGDLAVELDDARSDSRILLLDELHLGLHLLLPRSEDDDLSRVTNLVHGGKKDVDSLLLLKAADESEHGGIWTDREAGLPLQGSLGIRLTGFHGLRVVLEGQELVERRVPVRNVHSVDDALDALGRDHVVELDSELRSRRHLLGIGRGDGQKLVAGGDSGAEPVLLGKLLAWRPLVHLRGRGVLVEHHRVSVLEGKTLPGALRQIEVAERFGPEPSLERDVVDREGNLGIQEPSSRLHDVLDVDGNESSVPVVRDNHGILTRHEGEGREGLERSLAEERKALLVVDVVGSGLLSVELGPGLSPDLGQKPRVIDPHAVDTVLDGVEEANILAVNVDDDRRVPRVEVLVVTRGDREHVVSALGELHGQRSGHVTEASRLGPGRDLSGNKDHIEELGCQGRLRGRGRHRSGQLLDRPHDRGEAGGRGRACGRPDAANRRGYPRRQPGRGHGCHGGRGGALSENHRLTLR